MSPSPGSCGCVPWCVGVNNKVVPVTGGVATGAHEDNWEFVQIRVNRRIRVIHVLPDQTGHAPRQRKGTTNSRSEVEVDQGKVTYTKSRSDSTTDDDDDEEYWFDNADPIRMPIQPVEPKRNQQNRIFNKFEPQSTPKIPGIKPPRSSLGDKEQSRVTRSKSASPRLPRKVILPAEQLNLDDDDEDLVQGSPDKDDQTNGEELSAPASVVEDNFVANVLADMSDMVLNLTADATDGREGAEHIEHVPSQESEGRKSPSHFEKDASSPQMDSRKVMAEPNPVAEQDEESKGQSKVVVSGSHLGGMANVAFEEEELDNEESHNEEEGRSETDFADAGYRRNRDLSDALAQATEDVEVSAEPNGVPPIEPSSNHLQISKQLPVLFFIHGIGGSANTWSSQIKFFHRLGFEIVAPDILGHGFSSAPDNVKCYTFNKLLADMLTLLDHYVTCQNRICIIIGHSYGSSFASALARSRPNHVLELILLASGGPTPLAPPPGIKGVIPYSSCAITCLVKPLLKCGFLKQKKYNPRGRSIKFEQAYDIPSYVFKHIINGQHWPEGDMAFHRRLTMPTLLVYGLKDPFVSLVEMCEMERTIPSSYLELVPLAGHMIMLDRPKELNVMMRKFIFKYLENDKSRHRLRQ